MGGLPEHVRGLSYQGGKIGGGSSLQGRPSNGQKGIHGTSTKGNSGFLDGQETWEASSDSGFFVSHIAHYLLFLLFCFLVARSNTTATTSWMDGWAALGVFSEEGGGEGKGQPLLSDEGTSWHSSTLVLMTPTAS